MNTSLRDRVLAIVYALTIFGSAFLLFQIQPLVSKHILPWFGGTPAVWTTCMLFFQMLLFAGYAYAHASQAWLRPRQQAAVHLSILLLAAALVLLRVLPGPGWKPTETYHPVWQILLLLVLTIGMPYFVLATTGPLIQAWFARSFPGRSPYRLYALSNGGSLLALLSYPILFERWFDLSRQATLWAAGFVAFVLLCGYAAVRLRASTLDNQDDVAAANPPTPALPTPAREKATSPKDFGTPSSPRDVVRESKKPSLFQCAVWLILPGFASVVLLATTNHVCADVAVVPYLWIIPLSLYLITFIIAFDQPFWYRPIATVVFTLVTIYGVGLVHKQGFIDPVSVFDGPSFRWIRATLEDWKLLDSTALSQTIDVTFLGFLTLNFAAMFGICMLCHGELARRKPDPKHLTLYYLMIAAGGALGGIAVTIVAPLVFNTYFEWEASVFLGSLLAIGVALRVIIDAAFSDSDWSIAARVALLLPLTLAIALPATIETIDLHTFLEPSSDGVKLAVRNFFGALTVRERDPGDLQNAMLVLRHGAITHGSQFTDPSRRGTATTYYGAPTGVGRTLEYFRTADLPAGMQVGAVGLGTGTLAAYVGNGDAITFYEINPAVIAITEPGHWFTYLQDAKQRGAKYEIKLGDARLTLEREIAAGDPPRYHVLVIDAFSGDAIPAHLLTAEAFDVYVQHLAKPDTDGAYGALAVHISNRYLDLDPLVRGAAERFNLLSARLENNSEPSENLSSSTWIILSRNERLIGALRPHASTLEKPRPPILWTDQWSNLFDVLK